MFEISSKAYNLELRLEQAEVAKGESIEGVSLHWKDKFQSAIAAYEQREEASNGEKVQLRNRLMNSEDDRQKLKD